MLGKSHINHACYFGTLMRTIYKHMLFRANWMGSVKVTLLEKLLLDHYTNTT
ncbi:hypothetical protein VII_000746 [Vibrio mimicus MB451]|nr:hypothetical protein VII_000746 [Vibrio mimicus MB451]